MEVMGGSKSVLIYTFLYRKSELKIGFIPISYALANILFVMPMQLNVLLMVYRCFLELNNGGGIKDMSGSFYLATGTMSTVFIYSSFAMNHKYIIELVDLIDNVVNYRKTKIIQNDSSDYLTSIILFFSIWFVNY